MHRSPAAGRLAPIVAGIGGLAWFWAELAPQRFGFADTDDPAVGLQFVAAHPEAWVQAGLALAAAAIALIVTVDVTRDRLAGSDRSGTRDVGLRTVSTIGLTAAAFLLAMAAVRLSGGPLMYVRSLSETWGEMAYVVTQFVGIQLLAAGGLSLLAAWIAGVAWLGVRRGTVPRLLAALAVLPAIRLLSILGAAGLSADALWIVYMAAIPAAFVWLVLLGAWPAAARAEALAPSPVPL